MNKLFEITNKKLYTNLDIQKNSVYNLANKIKLIRAGYKEAAIMIDTLKKMYKNEFNDGLEVNFKVSTKTNEIDRGIAPRVYYEKVSVIEIFVYMDKYDSAKHIVDKLAKTYKQNYHEEIK